MRRSEDAHFVGLVLEKGTSVAIQSIMLYDVRT
jgi:hypothetical protein